jgi:hypothetical protein
MVVQNIMAHRVHLTSDVKTQSLVCAFQAMDGYFEDVYEMFPGLEDYMSNPSASKEEEEEEVAAAVEEETTGVDSGGAYVGSVLSAVDIDFLDCM